MRSSHLLTFPFYTCRARTLIYTLVEIIGEFALIRFSISFESRSYICVSVETMIKTRTIERNRAKIFPIYFPPSSIYSIHKAFRSLRSWFGKKKTSLLASIRSCNFYNSVHRRYPRTVTRDITRLINIDIERFVARNKWGI